MADIFISYSGEDKTIVRQIAGLLENKGWSVWWDRQIPIGQKYDTVIENEIEAASCVLVVWTQRSISSEWVKNEASEAARKGKLVPIVLEKLELPLAFKRIESARLIDWNGEEDHPELEILYHSIEHMIQNKGTSDSLTGVRIPDTSMLRRKKRAQIRLAGIVFGIILFVIGGFYLFQNYSDKNVIIRVFDWKKNPVTQGDVKIYLQEYIRNQSIDKLGQALFTGIPAELFKNKLKIEVSSPGYATKIFDTLLIDSKPLELTLPLTTVVFISGKVKTAAEIPIKGVEINVDGTRYYAISITDGGYNLRLEEYTIGDEISITTSHKDFEDKTFFLKINSPEIVNQDIFLNPIVQKN